MSDAAAKRTRRKVVVADWSAPIEHPAQGRAGRITSTFAYKRREGVSAMASSHEFAATKMFDNLMSTPEGALFYQQVYAGLRDGRWSEEYMDAIGQHNRRPPASWPQDQVAVFGFIHASVASGEIAMVPVPTSERPSHDADRQGNAAALASLPHPFKAEVFMNQNGADADGTITWTEPIEATVCSGLAERDGLGFKMPVPLLVTVPPGQAPLEIGSSLPSRTWWHLQQDWAVARWPYGHDRLRLFLRITCAEQEPELAGRPE
jgi:hypothetical protein